MSNVLTEFFCDDSKAFMSWINNGVRIEKRYKHPVIDFFVLADRTGIAVNESIKEKGLKYAVVFDADGQERFRLDVSEFKREFYGEGFAFVWEHEEKLAFIIGDGLHCHTKFIVDMQDGHVELLRPWR